MSERMNRTDWRMVARCVSRCSTEAFRERFRYLVESGVTLTLGDIESCIDAVRDYMERFDAYHPKCNPCVPSGYAIAMSKLLLIGYTYPRD